jgi:thiamine-phosphate pyrophosphorylase
VSSSGARAGRRPGPIYAIADVERLGAARLPAAVAELAAAGIATIQIRAKRLADRELGRVVVESRRALEGWTGELWIDDRVDVARLYSCSGVHLGQSDLPASAARALLDEACAIGVSTHDEAQLAAADRDAAADWVAFGPIFATATKQRPDPVVGLERLRAARARTAKPLIAIGGIDASNLEAVLAAGADSAAVISALGTSNLGAAAGRLLTLARAALEARCASS